MWSLNKWFVGFVFISVLFNILLIIYLTALVPYLLIALPAYVISMVLVVSLFGFFMGLYILLKADEKFRYLGPTKIIYSVLYIAPVLVYILFLYLLYMGLLGHLIQIVLPIIADAYLLGLLITIYFFNIGWSRGKRIAFAIYHGLFGLIYYVGLIWSVNFAETSGGFM